MFENTIKSIIMYGAGWDSTTGKPSEVSAKPEEVQAARAFAGLSQQGDLGAMMMKVLPAMFASDDPKQQAMGAAMWKDLTGYWYDPTGMFGWERGVVRPGEVGKAEQAENVAATKARIEHLQSLVDAGLLSEEETQEDINKLKESIGMPIDALIGQIRGPMDLK